jgi:hypothetical protein
MAALLMAGMQAPAAQPELGRPFELKPEQAVSIQGLRITFEGVAEDSRCPTGVQCVWAGDAAVEFILEKPPAALQRQTLHTHARYARQADYDAFVVRLADLKPYSKEGATIAPADYIATLVVTRREQEAVRGALISRVAVERQVLREPAAAWPLVPSRVRSETSWARATRRIAARR